MRRAKTFGIVLAAFCFIAASQLIWNDQTQAASGQGDALVKDISGLIDEADSARAADPKFLNDFSSNPRWQEAEGEFTIDGKRGLRSLAKKPAPSQADNLSERLNELEAKKADKGRFTLVKSSTLANNPYVPVGEEIERVQAAIKAAGGPSPTQGRLEALE